VNVVDRLLRRLSRTGLRRALAGEHWAWFVIAGAAFLLRRSRVRDDKVTTLDLHPGERYLVSVHQAKDATTAPAAD
jgi:hypothetical protein